MAFGYPFADGHVPALWDALINEFGTGLTYLPQGDASQAVTLETMLKDGVEPEDTFPGRYSYIDVQASDLPAAPTEADMVETADGRMFSVIRIDKTAYGYARIVLHEEGAVT